MSAPDPLLFDIQGYCLHDGPGVRTALFFSGCPLDCFWCANPEGKLAKPRLMYRETRCNCDSQGCLTACKNNAITPAANHKIFVDRARCETCAEFSCAASCHRNALELSGRHIGLNKLFAILKRDSFYWGEEGGVTLTGGEPLMQYDAAMAVLGFCADNGFHAALESSCHVAPEKFRAALSLADWLFADIKHMDAKAHARATGVDNELILSNIAALAKSDWKGRLVLRLPVIPGFNDSPDNLAATAAFIKENSLKEINILPYHNLGESKYKNLGMPYAGESLKPPSERDLARMAEYFERKGISCYIGSDTPF